MQTIRYPLNNWTKVGAILLFLCYSLAINAQTILRGTVRDADNQQPLVGANILLVDGGRGLTTDSLGQFRFTDLLPGRYQLRITYLGYEKLELQEILLTNGKETVLDIGLYEAATSLTSVVVKASRSNADNGPGIIRLTQEETLRFPATFNDPARLATAYPGVAGSNDQGNHLVIRGQSPLGMHWRLEGLEIVNPNHTANGGTFSDQPTVTGGGVNAISAQLLSETRFYLGNAPANYGNQTAGLLDMRLRNGNNQQREHTVQAGLIGFDIATEGPIREGGSSYLLNYRYSFTGLLADLGVSFGNEDIRFQDLSFKLNFPGKEGRNLSVFGLFGNSSNRFTAPADSTEWATDKDLNQNIDFFSRMGTVGFRYVRPQGDKGLFTTAGAWSATDSQRDAFESDLNFGRTDDVGQAKYSFQSSYRRKLLPYGSITIGWEGLYLVQQLTQRLRPDQATLFHRSEGLVLSPYLDWRYQIKKTELHLGWQATAYVGWLDRKVYSEPRLRIQQRLNKQAYVGADYNVSTQAPSPYAPAFRPRRARQYSLFYAQQLGAQRRLQLQLYQQELSQLAGVGVNSVIHRQSVSLGENTMGTSQARTRGVELSLQQFANGGWWYLLSATVFDARYLALNGEWEKTRFAQDYAATLTLGKEWSNEKQAAHPKRFGFNVALRYNGGLRALPIDLDASRTQQATIFDESQGFSLQNPDYFRTDLRIYYTHNRTGWSSTLSLDIQNVTGQQNLAYTYYDRLLERVNERYQLEFIPILSYRLNF